MEDYGTKPYFLIAVWIWMGRQYNAQRQMLIEHGMRVGEMFFTDIWVVLNIRRGHQWWQSEWTAFRELNKDSCYRNPVGMLNMAKDYLLVLLAACRGVLVGGPGAVAGKVRPGVAKLGKMLMELIRRPQNSGDSREAADKWRCVVCAEIHSALSVFVPCFHACACMECGVKLQQRNCPICNAKIEKVARLYLHNNVTE